MIIDNSKFHNGQLKTLHQNKKQTIFHDLQLGKPAEKHLIPRIKTLRGNNR